MQSKRAFPAFRPLEFPPLYKVSKRILVLCSLGSDFSKPLTSLLSELSPVCPVLPDLASWPRRFFSMWCLVSFKGFGVRGTRTVVQQSKSLFARFESYIRASGSRSTALLSIQFPANAGRQWVIVQVCWLLSPRMIPGWSSWFLVLASR